MQLLRLHVCEGGHLERSHRNTRNYYDATMNILLIRFAFELLKNEKQNNATHLLTAPLHPHPNSPHLLPHIFSVMFYYPVAMLEN